MTEGLRKGLSRGRPPTGKFAVQSALAYHGGGLDWERMLDLAAPLPNLDVEYASSWQQDNPVCAAVERLGPSRVMFGTDRDLLSPSLMVGLVDSAGLDPTAYATVLHGNANIPRYAVRTMPA